VLFRGFSGAHDRFMMHGRIAAEPVDAYLPIFEALSWAVALDERLATEFATGSLDRDWSWREQLSGGEVVAAFRFARNRAHHGWADVLHVTAGAVLPTPLPSGLFEWRWRQSLPPGGDRRGEEEYAALLADQPARLTLESLRRVFSGALGIEDPI
jgi:hypothetical protein